MQDGSTVRGPGAAMPSPDGGFNYDTISGLSIIGVTTRAGATSQPA